MAILSLLAMPVIYSFSDFLYFKNQELQTYADILKFLHPTNNVKISILVNCGCYRYCFWDLVDIFAGVVVSTVLY